MEAVPNTPLIKVLQQLPIIVRKKLRFSPEIKSSDTSCFLTCLSSLFFPHWVPTTLSTFQTPYAWDHHAYSPLPSSRRRSRIRNCLILLSSFILMMTTISCHQKRPFLRLSQLNRNKWKTSYFIRNKLPYTY